MKNNDFVDNMLPNHMKDVIDSLNIESSKVILSTETRSYGKKVTIVKGFEKGMNLSKIAKKLKSKCATGGSIKNESIVLQGNQLKRVTKILTTDGYRVELQ
jgi:translation initiation factor 1